MRLAHSIFSYFTAVFSNIYGSCKQDSSCFVRKDVTIMLNCYYVFSTVVICYKFGKEALDPRVVIIYDVDFCAKWEGHCSC